MTTASIQAHWGGTKEHAQGILDRWVKVKKLKHDGDGKYSLKSKEVEKATKVTFGSLVKGGPYIGKRGGKWADAQHTISWKEGTGKSPEGTAPTKEEKEHAANTRLKQEQEQDAREISLSLADREHQTAYAAYKAKREAPFEGTTTKAQQWVSAHFRTAMPSETEQKAEVKKLTSIADAHIQQYEDYTTKYKEDEEGARERGDTKWAIESKLSHKLSQGRADRWRKFKVATEKAETEKTGTGYAERHTALSDAKNLLARRLGRRES